MAGRNIFKATLLRKFEGILKPMPPPPPSLSASKQQKIFKPIPSLLIHLRDRLPQPSPHVTSENSGRFFITCDKFNLKIKQIGDDLEKIK